jgi:hypothetical protein
MPATGTAATTATASAAVTVDRLLEIAWTVDCAIRLRQPAWASASAEDLLANLARYGRQIQARWARLDRDVAQSLARDVLAVQLAAVAIADALCCAVTWPVADLYDQVARLIHREAIAVGDTAWGLD